MTFGKKRVSRSNQARERSVLNSSVGRSDSREQKNYRIKKRKRKALNSSGGTQVTNNDLKSEIGYTEICRSEMSEGGRRQKVVDWATLPFFDKVLRGQAGFNPEKDPQFFRAEEIDYILSMIKERYRDFRENDMT